MRIQDLLSIKQYNVIEEKCPQIIKDLETIRPLYEDAGARDYLRYFRRLMILLLVDRIIKECGFQDGVAKGTIVRLFVNISRELYPDISYAERYYHAIIDDMASYNRRSIIYLDAKRAGAETLVKPSEIGEKMIRILRVAGGCNA